MHGQVGWGGSQLNARHEESGNNGDGSVPAGQLFRPSPPLCPHPCQRSFNLDARIIRHECRQLNAHPYHTGKPSLPKGKGKDRGGPENRGAITLVEDEF